MVRIGKEVAEVSKKLMLVSTVTICGCFLVSEVSYKS